MPITSIDKKTSSAPSGGNSSNSETSTPPVNLDTVRDALKDFLLNPQGSIDELSKYFDLSTPPTAGAVQFFKGLTEAHSDSGDLDDPTDTQRDQSSGLAHSKSPLAGFLELLVLSSLDAAGNEEVDFDSNVYEIEIPMGDEMPDINLEESFRDLTFEHESPQEDLIKSVKGQDKHCPPCEGGTGVAYQSSSNYGNKIIEDKFPSPSTNHSARSNTQDQLDASVRTFEDRIRRFFDRGGTV